MPNILIRNSFVYWRTTIVLCWERTTSVKLHLSVNIRPLVHSYLIWFLAVCMIGGCLIAPAQSLLPARTTVSQKKKKKNKARKRKASARVRRMARAFVASAQLKPMARQLLESRSPAAYRGVEAYARKHGGDAGALAWLVVGYAHILDHDYGKAIAPLKRAQPHAGDLGDYVAYFLATSYGGSADSANATATLKNF